MPPPGVTLEPRGRFTTSGPRSPTMAGPPLKFCTPPAKPGRKPSAFLTMPAPGRLLTAFLALLTSARRLSTRAMIGSTNPIEGAFDTAPSVRPNPLKVDAKVVKCADDELKHFLNHLLDFFPRARPVALNESNQASNHGRDDANGRFYTQKYVLQDAHDYEFDGFPSGLEDCPILYDPRNDVVSDEGDECLERWLQVLVPSLLNERPDILIDFLEDGYEIGCR